MRELKRFDIVGKYADEEVMYEFRPDGECYDADEVDALTAELEENHKKEVEQLLIANREQELSAKKIIAELNMRICDGDEDFEIANNQIERLLKIVRQQKYKRCLAMSEQCKESMRLMRTYEATDDYWNLEPGQDAEYFCKKGDFYSTWRKRWLKLADKFKEA